MNTEQLTHRVARRFTAAGYDGKYNYEIKGESVVFEIRLFHEIEGFTLRAFQIAHNELVRDVMDDVKNEVKLTLEDMEMKADFDMDVPLFHKAKNAWKGTLKVEFELDLQSDDPSNAVTRVQETLEDLGINE